MNTSLTVSHQLHLIIIYLNQQQMSRVDSRKKSATLQGGVAPFVSKGTDIETTPFVKEKDGMRIIGANKSIDEDAFVEGLWDDSPNSSKDIVENSRLESVENAQANGIIEETVDSDTGVPSEYNEKIVWGIFNHHPARRCGKGYYGKRVKQHNSRVDNYELKINPNNESYYLQHPDGRYVQFENMVDNVLQDGKCVLNKKRSFYHVYDYGYIAQKRVLEQANRQVEVANAAGYKVKWLISDEKAVEQISRLFKENNINIIVKFYPE